MNQSRTIKAVVALLTLVIVLTSVSAAQTHPPLEVDDGSLVNVTQGNVEWERLYGGAADDRAFYSLPVADGLLVLGSTKSASNTTEGWALMLNSEGNIVWDRTFLYGAGTELRCAVDLADGYLLVGNQFAESNDVNGYVAKVDEAGVLLWDTVLGGERVDKLFSGAVSSDGFAVFGLTYSHGSGGAKAWIASLDGEGGVIWDRTYEAGFDCALRSGVSTQDGFAAAGYVDTGEGNYDFLLLKVASDGAFIWNRTFGGAESQKAYSVTSAVDGYVLVGESTSTETSTDAWVVKVTFDGDLQWSRLLRGGDADSPAYVTPSRDGGFLICGFTFSFGAGQRDFWLFKIGGDGQVLFAYTVGTEAFQEAYGVVEAADGGYVLVGWTDPPGRPDLIGEAEYDFWVVKLGVAGGDSSANPWLTVTSGAVFLGLVATLILLVKLRPKKQK